MNLKIKNKNESKRFHKDRLFHLGTSEAFHQIFITGCGGYYKDDHVYLKNHL